MFDLDAYLRRINQPRSASPDLRTLVAVHRAHVAAIPFENLDIQMGRGIQLDSATLQADLVQRRRGGYCFQQNELFRLALCAIGFEPRACEGRVRAGGGPVRPRTHMMLIVTLDDRQWLLDVGFGGDGLIEPMTLDGSPVDQEGWTYRVVPEGRDYVLQRAVPASDAWEDLYQFSTDQTHPADYTMANWFTSTHPDSGFVRSLTAQRIDRGTRHILRNLTYREGRGGTWRETTIARDALVPFLRRVFDLDVPEEARFSALDDDARESFSGAV